MVEEITFVSDFDNSQQKYLIQKPRTSLCNGIFVYLHGATNHMEQGFNKDIFDGTFGKLQEFFYKYHYVYVCPEYRGDSWMNEPAESDILFIINSLRRCYQTERVFLMGGSMGGTAALIFSTRHPQLISGVCALCPATNMIALYHRWVHTEYDFLAKGIEIAYQGSPDKRPEEYRKRSSIYFVGTVKTKPVAIIHGDDDKLISVEHSRNFVKESIRQGVRIFYQEIRYGDHDSPVNWALIEKVLLWFEFIQAQ